MPKGVYPRTPEICHAISEARKNDLHLIERLRIFNKVREGKPLSEEHKHKISLGMLGKQNLLGYEQSKEHRHNISQGVLRSRTVKQSAITKWQNLEYRTKQIKAIIKGGFQRPTAPEKRVLDAIEQCHLPYEYTGDGSFIIHGICPDFINTNSQKIVLEVFGNYWHDPDICKWQRTELGRIMVYNSFGFRCLVLWEDNIWGATLEEIAQQITKFERREK